MTLQFIDRLNRTLATLPPHLERAPIASVDDGLRWMREWHAPDGVYVWMGRSDAERRRAVKHWFFVRWRYRHVWRERGGRIGEGTVRDDR